MSHPLRFAAIAGRDRAGPRLIRPFSAAAIPGAGGNAGDRAADVL